MILSDYLPQSHTVQTIVGAQKATTARKLSVIFYNMMKYKSEYRDMG